MYVIYIYVCTLTDKANYKDASFIATYNSHPQPQLLHFMFIFCLKRKGGRRQREEEIEFGKAEPMCKPFQGAIISCIIEDAWQ